MGRTYLFFNHLKNEETFPIVTTFRGTMEEQGKRKRDKFDEFVVTWDGKAKKWKAYAMIPTRLFLGFYDSENAATNEAKKYKRAWSER